MSVECCGRKRESRYCSNCGKKLLDPLQELLAYVVAKGSGRDPGLVTEEGWQSWADALGRLINHKDPRGVDVISVGFPSNAIRAFNNLGVKMLTELPNLGAEKLLEQNNFGQATLKSVRERLAEYGLKLNGE